MTRNNNAIIRCKVSGLPKDFLQEFDENGKVVGDIIPERYDNCDVKYVKDTSRTNIGSVVNREINIRWIKKQLGITMTDVNKRQFFYMVRSTLGGESGIDLKGDSTQQYISFSSQIKGVCEYIAEEEKLPYWGFALEIVGIPSKEKVIVYDKSKNKKLLDVEQLDYYADAPFFIIICEKAQILEDFVFDLYDRGYRFGFYGYVLQGYANTTLIKLLLKLKGKQQFKIAILSDLDLNGLQIMFDMVRYCDKERVIPVAVNQRFLNYIGYNFDKVSETYAPEKVNDLVTGCYNMLDQLNYDVDEKNEIIQWIESCKYRRVELDSVVAENIRKNKKKIGNFVDYFLSLVEVDNVDWDLNREIEPRIKLPDYIGDIKSNVERKATESIDRYLNSKDYDSTSTWLDTIDGLRDKLDEFKQKNSHYTGKLNKEITKLIKSQNDELQKIVESSGLYVEVEEELKKLEKVVIDKLIEAVDAAVESA